MSDTTPANEIYLDLRGMHPPEPMEKVVDALATLLAGQHVRMLIEREPQPLFRILERNGYLYDVNRPAPGLFEITIRQGG